MVSRTKRAADEHESMTRLAHCSREPFSPLGIVKIYWHLLYRPPCNSGLEKANSTI